MDERDSRRAFLTIAGAGTLLAACRKQERATSEEPAASATTRSAEQPGKRAEDKGPRGGSSVSATEDLMREHGVIRRVLVVYRECAARLRTKPASVPPDALQKCAKLIRSFAEDYHEKQLEEANVFPALTKTGGERGATVSTLVAQHERGRQITDFVLAVTAGSLGATAAGALAHQLEEFARMYEAHAAIEDTVIFPAWKKTMSPAQLDETGERFEGIEHKAFGGDGFDMAVSQIGAVEKELGLELAQMTPPPPGPPPK